MSTITTDTTPRPEFCPNSGCRFHSRETAADYEWFAPHGQFHTECRGSIQRFRCRECGKTCSTQTFSVHYWTHSTNDLVWLLGHLHTCSGLRQIGRLAGVTHRVIANRCRRLARNALSVMDLALRTMDLNEDLAFDGFESYTRSHYHPNNITHIVGSKSQFIYAAVHTLLRRKGAMTDGQRRHRSVIDQVWRPHSSVGSDCRAVFADIANQIDGACDRPQGLTLHSDEHPAYPKAIRSVPGFARRLDQATLRHHQTSSRAARTVRNPLFAVNYVDRQIRSTSAEHVRETTRHGREVNAQMERFAVFAVVHNFLTPHRIDGKADAGAALRHADHAGIKGDQLRWLLERMTQHRIPYTHTSQSIWWIRRIWLHLHHNPPAVKVRRGTIIETAVAAGPGAVPRYLLA